MEKIWFVKNESSGLHATKTDVQKHRDVVTICDIGFTATHATDRKPTPDDRLCEKCAQGLRDEGVQI